MLIVTASIFIVSLKKEFTAIIDAPISEIMKVETTEKLVEVEP